MVLHGCLALLLSEAGLWRSRSKAQVSLSYNIVKGLSLMFRGVR